MKNKTLIILLLLFIQQGIRAAVVSPPPPDTLKLDEVVVTASQPGMQERSPIPVQQLGPDQLQRTGGTSAADMIRTMGGITLKDYGGIGGLKTVMVRSLGAQHTGVMVDGMPISDAATGQTDLGRISMLHKESISLFVGQPGDSLRPARHFASASIIEINRTHDLPVGQRSRSIAGIRAGSFGVANPYVATTLRLRGRTIAGVYADYTRAHGRYNYLSTQSGMQEERKNTDVESMGAGFFVRHTSNNRIRIDLDGTFYSSERGLPGAGILYNPFASQRMWNDDMALNLRIRHQSPDKIQWQSLARYTRSWLRYLDPQFLNQQGFLNNTYLQQEYYVSQGVAVPIHNLLNLSLSSDLFLNTLETNIPGFQQPRRTSWLTHLGGDFHWQRLQAHAGVLATVIFDERQDEGNHTQVLSPAFSLAYRITSSEPVMRIRLMYKNIFRMPTFNDLYYTLVGNQNLKPENASQLNLGLTASGQWNGQASLSGSVDAFYNRVEDKIVAIPTRNLFVWSMQNIGMVDIRGVEVLLRGDVSVAKGTGMHFFSNYTFQKATDVSISGSNVYGHQIPYIPRETFSGGWHVSYRDVTLGFNSVYSGHRYYLGENRWENMLPSWWHHDVVATWQFAWSGFDLSLKAEVSNLLNDHYEVIRSFPMPGRGYFLTLGFTF